MAEISATIKDLKEVHCIFFNLPIKLRYTLEDGSGLLPIQQIVATVAATVPARCSIFAAVD